MSDIELLPMKLKRLIRKRQSEARSRKLPEAVLSIASSCLEWPISFVEEGINFELSRESTVVTIEDADYHDETWSTYTLATNAEMIFKFKTTQRIPGNKEEISEVLMYRQEGWQELILASVESARQRRIAKIMEDQKYEERDRARRAMSDFGISDDQFDPNSEIV